MLKNNFVCSFLKIGVCIYGLSYISIASAAVVYDETVDGDLIDGTYIPLFAGEHTVVGTASWGGYTWDTDSFEIGIAEGFTITNISITAANGSTDGLSAGYTQWDITKLSDVHTPLGAVRVFSDNSTAYMLAPNYPLPPETYLLWNNSAFSGRNGHNVSLDYEWTINVAATPVPLPAAAWLFFSAMGGLIGLKQVARNWLF